MIFSINTVLHNGSVIMCLFVYNLGEYTSKSASVNEMNSGQKQQNEVSIAILHTERGEGLHTEFYGDIDISILDIDEVEFLPVLSDDDPTLNAETVNILITQSESNSLMEAILESLDNSISHDSNEGCYFSSK